MYGVDHLCKFLIINTKGYHNFGSPLLLKLFIAALINILENYLTAYMLTMVHFSVLIVAH